MFEGWENFYLMIGSAAAGLIGLLFVVATLTGGLGADKAEMGARVYLTPTVSHFAVVLATACITAIPHLTARTAGGLVAAAALWGLGYSINVALMLHARKGPTAPHWTDFWCYGWFPTGLYLALLAGSAALATGFLWAQEALAAALLALLLLTIRNAWDLVISIAPVVNSKS